MPKPLVIQTEHLDAPAAEWLAERCELVAADPGNPAELERLLPNADGLVIRTYTKINTNLLARAPRLKVVGRAGVGLDNVDLAACRGRGVQVVYTPDANTRAVIEYVVALLLDITRPRAFLEGPLEAERWREVRQEMRASRQLCEMTLGILGLGRIGSGVARVAGALAMPVIYHDIVPIAPERRFGAVPVSREELFERADAITVHIDGRPGNRKAVSTDALGRMKPNAVFINTSRGFVVDNLALAEFMISHQETGAVAMLDVHEPEPFDKAYPLLDIPNVHLAPHLASATDLAQQNMSWVVRDVVKVLEGQAPEHPAPDLPPP